ncbi:DUF6152 family protein [Tranquillimonas alkanivorans]|uniref:DNA-binding protein n=1 Tax=Tranquillimonas alkanivorans TaxID=441119 RepID=A0A1I5NYV2_9RHOB|nr:DUF6152 family protein [Tranquillimonas alkanivorans]SFP26945.1 hypothetical protein SAMN04488047_104148 [Tranquillimonas alkanivorans]
MPLTRRLVLAAALGAIALPSAAHHGWRWTDGGQFELTGIITHADLGNPHGVLTVDANGELWMAQVGQPWRNQQAGLTDEMLSPGTEITVLGERSADPEQLIVKAEAVVIGGQKYVLYPDRV